MLKIFLLLLSVITLEFASSQSGKIKSHHSPKKTGGNIIVQDSLGVLVNAKVESKIDTLYLKSLNPIEKKKNEWLKDILPLIGAVIGGFLGWLSQAHLKKQDKRVNSFNLKEAKRIDHLEKIFFKINELTDFDATNSQGLISLVSNLQSYRNANGLYIGQDYIKIIDNVCDYFVQVASNIRHKNISTEIAYLKEYSVLFNK